jgi:hypothetical protein
MSVTYISRADKDERIAIRVSAKDKFAIELLAQKLGKTISALAKEALEKSLKDPESGLLISRGSKQAYLPDLCWDPIESDRLVKLAMHAPHLLTNNDMLRWKVIAESKIYMSTDGKPNFKKIRGDWQKITLKATELYNS